MTLDLTDEETDALARLLTDTIANDRYPLSPRVQVLKAILGKTGTRARAIVTAEALRAAAGGPPPTRMRSVHARRRCDYRGRLLLALA